MVLQKFRREPETPPEPPASVRVWHDQSGAVLDIGYDELPDYQAKGYSVVTREMTDLAPRNPESTGLGASARGVLAKRQAVARARLDAASGPVPHEARKRAEIPYDVVDLETLADVAERLRSLHEGVIFPLTQQVRELAEQLARLREEVATLKGRK